MTVVSLQSVSFSYPDARTPALVDVNVEVPEGAFALVAGPTASGKSTLLRTMNGLVPHFSGGRFSGRAFAGGRSTLEHAPRELADVVAFVPQDAGSSFVLDRVEDELAYGMENLGVPPERMRRRVEETLDLLAIEPLRARSVRTLSGGERQRVAIAAAMAAGPRTLVLDEPTSQLDPQGAEDVLAALQRMVHDLGLTVVLAEHRLERVAGFADLALGCRGGRVFMADPARAIEALGSGPPVARLGSMLGWTPPPLTVRSARTLASGVSLPGPPSDGGRAGAGLLTCDGVVAGYGERTVLHGVELTIGAGEIVAVMGRNGSGKTTLLRCLAGLHEVDAGRVFVHGRPPQPGRDVALCPQVPEAVLYRDTVLDEVRTTVLASQSSVDARGLLDALGIEHLARAHPRDLSAGQRLLVAAAALAATGAPVLLLDEPTRGLDADSKARMTAYLRARSDNEQASLFATHDVELAAEAATRVVMLAGGEVIADGPPADVLGDSPVFAPQMSRVFGAGWLTPDQVVAASQAPDVENADL